MLQPLVIRRRLYLSRGTTPKEEGARLRNWRVAIMRARAPQSWGGSQRELGRYAPRPVGQSLKKVSSEFLLVGPSGQLRAHRL
jgi:hypothetical protein